MESSRIFDYFFECLSTFYVILKRLVVKMNRWKVFSTWFLTFWWLSERSSLSIKRYIGSFSLKKTNDFGLRIVEWLSLIIDSHLHTEETYLTYNKQSFKGYAGRGFCQILNFFQNVYLRSQAEQIKIFSANQKIRKNVTWSHGVFF